MESLLELIFYLLPPFVEDYERFWVCVLAGAAGTGFIVWLVPGHGLKIALSIISSGLGIAGGILWQARSGKPGGAENNND